MKYIKNIFTISAGLMLAVFGWYFYRACDMTCAIETDLVTPARAQMSDPPATTTLIAVGDIMPGRTVESKMQQYDDWLYPFRETYQVTTTGDIVFGNLESPLIDGATTPAYNMVFRADPGFTAGLQFGGFNILSLANNHMKNQGTEGIINTRQTLDNANIYHVGAGENIDQASHPVIMEKNGIKFAFLAYLDSSFVPDSYGAKANTSGSPFMEIEKMQQNIKNIQNQADVIIVSMHAGTEYADRPNQKQIDFAHAAIESGAELVIGHHPHVVQPVEYYQDGIILYSLGNFIFDQMWSEKTREGAMAVINFSGTEITNLELIPVKIFDYSQPRVLTETQGQEILNRMSDFTF